MNLLNKQKHFHFHRTPIASTHTWIILPNCWNALPENGALSIRVFAFPNNHAKFGVQKSKNKLCVCVDCASHVIIFHQYPDPRFLWYSRNRRIWLEQYQLLYLYWYGLTYKIVLYTQILCGVIHSNSQLADTSCWCVLLHHNFKMFKNKVKSVVCDRLTYQYM